MYNTEVTQASNFVKGVDTAFLLIIGICFLILIGLTVAMMMFIIKYNKKKHPKAVQIEGSTKLEITWTVIPFLITMLMFYYGWLGWIPMRRPPKDATQITVYGRMWNWNYEYENGKRSSDTLYLPENKSVKLNLVSLDVIHSFYIPSFRVKQDVVPDKKNDFMWFKPQRKGLYDIFCAEYCGLQHSYMHSIAKVMEDSLFEKWMIDTTKVQTVAETESPAVIGKRIMQNIGCFACHTIDGTKLVGPSYKGIWGEKQTVVTGKETRQVVVDEDYVRRSVYDPNADVVQGFNKGLMLSYKGQLSDDDVSHIIEFLKTLK